ncbi:hypothetical protein COHA_009936 [Chlorella ohadii]|uniref:Uncharacterized protein n=1 Tax=Chlorella ohadii TaxID=2649997 RepID=A0AAD5DHA4_9CHLO|nr:hypothetical protein COHA_009936 [Chlorella ohadii]
MEELRQYSRGHLLNLLRATAAGEDSEGATVSTAAAPQRAASPACEGPLPRAAEAEAAEAAGLAAQERREQRPQQHELLQEPAARPQQETPVGTGAAALQQAAPKQAAPQQAAVQQHEPQQPELALPGGFYHHYFGVTPQLPDPTVTSYKAQLNLALASNGQPQRPSRRVGGKAAQPVCLLACPTQAEAAAARDLGALWREQRLRGGGSKPHRGHRPLFNFDESRWEQEQGELLAAVRQCATLRQLQKLLAVCLANGTLRALGSSMPRDAASWQLATQRRAADGDGSKRWRPSLKRALAQLAPGRSRSWDGLQHGLDGGTVSGGEEGGGRRRRHSRLARSQSLTDSHGYDSELAEQEAAAAGVRQPVLQSTGAAQAALLALAAAAAADPQEGQAGPAMATEGTAAVGAAAVGAAGGAAAGAADELESDYLGVRKCPDGGWRVVVPVRLDGLGAPALVGFKCLQSFELLSEQEAALVRDLGLLWYEQWCGPESFRDNRLWNFALRRQARRKQTYG